MATKLTLESALRNWLATRSNDDKKTFNKLAKKALKDVADYLCLPKGTYEISWCKGGPAVLGETILHHDNVYVSLSEISYFRGCDGRNDYTGYQNNMTHVSTFDNPLSAAQEMYVKLGVGNDDVIASILTLPHLPIHKIAGVIRANWHDVYFGAAPYLAAMNSLWNVSDSYGYDSGKEILLYFLGNAQQWKGAVARDVKAEIKRRLK